MNRANLIELLNNVQYKCTKRIMKFDHVENMINYAERKLMELKIPKKLWKGCKVYREPMRSEGWTDSEDTTITLERGSEEWYVVNVKRVVMKKGNKPYKNVLVLSEEAFKRIGREIELPEESELWKNSNFTIRGTNEWQKINYARQYPSHTEQSAYVNYYNVHSRLWLHRFNCLPNITQEEISNLLGMEINMYLNNYHFDGYLLHTAHDMVKVFYYIRHVRRDGSRYEL